MPAYTILCNWTEQGVKNTQKTVSRARDAEKLLESMGGRNIGVWWTIGPYDMVFIAEAPDDATISKFVTDVAKQGNVRSLTMRSFSEEEALKLFGG